MINALLTLYGAWDKLFKDPILQFLCIGLLFYGLATFEGPLLAIKSVNALGHYTEWVISHVHSGGMGWVGFISMASIYMLVPELWDKKDLYSNRLVSWHLCLAVTGIILYISSMWIAGVMQGIMASSYDDMGFLKYNFIEIVRRLPPLYFVRALGGLFYLSGACIMAYNIYKTINDGEEASA